MCKVTCVTGCVCVSKCIYICMRVYMHVCTCMCVHAFEYVRVYMHGCIYMHLHAYVYVHNAHICMHAWICTCVCVVCVHACVHACKQATEHIWIPATELRSSGLSKMPFPSEPSHKPSPVSVHCHAEWDELTSSQETTILYMFHFALGYCLKGNILCSHIEN